MHYVKEIGMNLTLFFIQDAITEIILNRIEFYYCYFLKFMYYLCIINLCIIFLIYIINIF